jgi:tetratricopeptide (TPR) repeat protein
MKNLLNGLFLFPCLIFCQNSYHQAEGYFRQQKFDNAKPLFQEYLKEYPSHQKTREYLGDIAGYAKEWDTAIAYYEDLLADDANSATYNYKYGGALGMKALEVNRFVAITYIGDIKSAFENAARLDSNHIDVRWALVEFYMRLPGVIGGSEFKAIKYADELGRISPVDGYLAKGFIAEYGNHFKEAERFYKKAIEVGGSWHSYKKLLNLYEKNNEIEKAREVSAKLLELNKL